VDDILGNKMSISSDIAPVVIKDYSNSLSRHKIKLLNNLKFTDTRDKIINAKDDEVMLSVLLRVTDSITCIYTTNV
jgi:hypothetical protein